MSEQPTETCYCCGLVIRDGEMVYRLRDKEGLEFLAHKACAETDMERGKVVPDPAPRRDIQ